MIGGLLQVQPLALEVSELGLRPGLVLRCGGAAELLGDGDAGEERLARWSAAAPQILDLECLGEGDLHLHRGFLREHHGGDPLAGNNR